MKNEQKDPMEGSLLPYVSLESTEGRAVVVPRDWEGKWVLLYFYPKDDTPGCTKQACAYRDSISQFEKLNVKLYGVSGDSIDSHRQFQSKFSLPFPLLSDVSHELSSVLGVYGEQSWNGKSYMGLSRDTFLIDPAGVIRKVWRKVKPEVTTEETFSEASRLITEG